MAAVQTRGLALSDKVSVAIGKAPVTGSEDIARIVTNLSPGQVVRFAVEDEIPNDPEEIERELPAWLDRTGAGADGRQLSDNDGPTCGKGFGDD